MTEFSWKTHSFYCESSCVPVPNIQGFIQAILMYGRRHKKLNLLIEFSNSIFIKFCFKAYKNMLTSNVHSNKIILLGFLYFQLFICPPDVKKPKFLRGFATWTSTRAPPSTRCRVSIFVQKRTLVKVLG